MIIAVDFREPRGRRWKGIGSTVPTPGRGKAKATLKLLVSPILLCSCTILMQVLAIVFQSLIAILSFLAANSFLSKHDNGLTLHGLVPQRIPKRFTNFSWFVAKVHRHPFIHHCSDSRTTCHKCLAKHRSSLQYFRLGCDECFTLLNLNEKVEHNYVSRNSVAHNTLTPTPSALHLLLNSYYSAF